MSSVGKGEQHRDGATCVLLLCACIICSKFTLKLLVLKSRYGFIMLCIYLHIHHTCDTSYILYKYSYVMAGSFTVNMRHHHCIYYLFRIASDPPPQKMHFLESSPKKQLRTTAAPLDNLGRRATNAL